MKLSLKNPDGSPTPKTRRIYFVVRNVATDELRIPAAVPGYTPPPADSEFTWGGPFKSLQAAKRALKEKSSTLRKQLYPE